MAEVSGRWAKALESVKSAREALERKVEKAKEAHSDMGTRAFRKTMMGLGAAATGLVTGRTKVMVKDEKTGEKKLERRKLFGVPYGFAFFGVTTLGKNKFGRMGEALDYAGDGAMSFELGRAAEAAGDKWRIAAEKGAKKKKDGGEDEETRHDETTPGKVATKGLPDGAAGRGLSPQGRNQVASFLNSQ